jgi:hypothetical protein
MSETTTESTETNTEGKDKPEQPEQTFTQADVDRIVRERVTREREKFADYDELKATAGKAKTAEERITALENEIEATRLSAARAQIATEFKLTDKQAAALKYAPSEEAAREIAEGLAAETSAQQRNGNHVPNEGTNPQSGEDQMARFTDAVFGHED